MNKCHTPITWVNDTTPAINETHLNQYDGELDTLDDRIISLDTTKADESDLLVAFKDVSLNSSTGVITFTLFNNTTKTIDTLLEKIAINFDYDDDPTSAHYQNLIITLEDGTYKYIDMSALITQYEFTNSSTVAFTVGNDGSVTASVVDGSITASKLQPNYLADVTAQANAASGSATTASNKALEAEGWSVGTQNSVPVTSGSPYFQNNAKWYKDQAQQIAGSSIGGLSDVTIVDPIDLQLLQYNATSQQWENSQAFFNLFYSLVTQTTVVNKDNSGNTTSIVETTSIGVATTTFAESGGVKTITTVIVPTVGAYNYTKTATITTSANATTIAESYTQTAKE